MDTTYYQAVQPVLNAFLKDLRAANELHQKSDNGGRDGMILALKSITDFCNQFFDTADENLSIPFVNMMSALADLDKGIVAPLVKPKSKSGKPLESEIRQNLRAASVAGLEMLVKIGIEEQEAAKRISSLLKRLNVSNLGGGVYIQSNTLIKWKEKIAREYRSKAREIKDIFVKECSPSKDIPSNEAAIMILKGIEALVSRFRAAG